MVANSNSNAHVLILPYPSQGHINPMLQFAKNLMSKGPNATLVTTHFILTSIKAQPGPVQFKPISDGFDRLGFTSDITLETYLAHLEDIGSKSLLDLIEVETCSARPFTCIVYDTFVPWGFDVAKRVGLPAVAFSTQSCVASAVYYYVKQGLVKVPRTGSSISVAGSVLLTRSEFPSLVRDNGSYPTLSGLALEQFRLEIPDWILFNSFDELESKVINCLKDHFHARTIGPTVPLTSFNKHLEEEEEEEDMSYGMNLLQAADNEKCKQWLNSKPPSSVVYISFGSFATLGEEQMGEIANGLMASNKSFIWVVRDSEQKKLPRNFMEQVSTHDPDTQENGPRKLPKVLGGSLSHVREEDPPKLKHFVSEFASFPGPVSDSGLVVSWSQQLAMLAHDSVGCFVTHCGWNSTLEALSLGVPMVAVPQWTDQPTNAKYVEDVWRVGVRAKIDKKEGMFIKSEEIERCIREVMDGEKGDGMKRNAKKWKDSAKKALSEGGSSDENLNEFVEFLNSTLGENSKKFSGVLVNVKAEN